MIVEAVVDPLAAPMPAKITAEQALHLAKSLARGEPDRGEIMKTIFKDRIRELI
jgi:pyruvate dehydrogenase (quinone)